MRKNTQAIINAFKQHQAKGKRGDSISTDGKQIVSYTTPIAEWSYDGTAVLLLTKKFTHTTTLQQNSIRTEFNGQIVETPVL